MDDFLGLIVSTWYTSVDGNRMYRLTNILELLKPKLKVLHRLYTSHISSHVVEVKAK